MRLSFQTLVSTRPKKSLVYTRVNLLHKVQHIWGDIMGFGARNTFEFHTRLVDRWDTARCVWYKLHKNTQDKFIK